MVSSGSMEIGRGMGTKGTQYGKTREGTLKHGDSVLGWYCRILDVIQGKEPRTGRQFLEAHVLRD